MTSIAELSWFYDPYISEGSFYDLSVFHLFLLSFDGILSFFMVGCESFILWIFGAFFDVEGER